MFDLLIKQATIINGTGTHDTPVADIGIRHGCIAAMDAAIQGEAKQVIDAQGLAAAPGFIDMHSHADVAVLEPFETEIKLRQGVTLEVLGNCGSSIAPFDTGSRDQVLQNLYSDIDVREKGVTWTSVGQYAEQLKKNGLSINAMSLVGHATLRVAAMGMSDKAPDTSQMDRMKQLLAEAIDDGACGLSTGLIYAPGCYANTDEVLELAEVLHQKGGFYASHMRNEAGLILDAVDEVIRIGKTADVPVQISHLKVAGSTNRPLVDSVISRIETARKEGLDITCDVYPYFCSSTTILALLPPWSLEGGAKSLLPRLNDPSTRKRIIHEIKNGLPGWENMYHNAGWDKITIAAIQGSERKHMQGRTLSSLARDGGCDPFEWILDLITAEKGRKITIISESMNETDVTRFLLLPFAMVGSDGLPGDGRPHPRLYGTFPRVIRRFVNELGVLTLPEAIHKMTGMPAQRLGLKDRGRLAIGCRADIVILDPGNVVDQATFDEPRQYPSGIGTVIVDGEVVIHGGEHTGSTPGRFIKYQS
jgi:N-acyl-D-aspartate/D-glutamate deacylase